MCADVLREGAGIAANNKDIRSEKSGIAAIVDTVSLIQGKNSLAKSGGGISNWEVVEFRESSSV